MDLNLINQKLQAARYSVDIFGVLNSDDIENKLKELKGLFNLMAKNTHEDLFGNTDDKKIAHEAFIKLTEWHERAIKDLEAGNYGKKEQIKIKTKKGVIIIHDIFHSGGIADIFNCTKEGDTKKDLVLKLVRDSANCDLANNEINVLKQLFTHTGEYLRIITNHTIGPLEIFEIDKKPAILFEKLNGFYSLQDVINQYKTGIDPKNIAWIFRRMLGILGAIHGLGLVHGNVIPSNFLICPENHNGKLIDFTNTVKIGQKAKFINGDHLYFYPPEMRDKRELTPASDIYMAAKCMLELLGNVGNVPEKILNFLHACTIDNPHRRLNNSLDIHRDFGDTIDKIWTREFHKFEMPNPANKQ